MNRNLVPLDAVTKALAEIRSPAQAKHVADKAEALRHYARLTKDRSLYLQAAELELRAMRRLGQMLAEIERAGRGKRSNLEHLPTLDELGISRKEAMHAQRLWELPGPVFEERLPETVAQAVARASRGLNYMIKSVARPAAPVATKPLPDGEYRAILADPPWQFKTWSDAGMDRAPDQHYPTMPIADICALPVAELAADDAVLFLWVYDPLLPEALKVIEHWGFVYKTRGLTWVKPHFGGGYWFRHRSEIMLVATRGSPRRIDAGVDDVIDAPRFQHSVKPFEQYARIERLVAGPYIELVAGEDGLDRPGWTFWGNPHRGE